MNAQIWSFFLLITSSTWCYSQIDERFDQVDLFASIEWDGDLDKFIVRGEQLLLNDSEAGQARLIHPRPTPSEWEMAIDFNLDFAPSNQNNLVVDLWYQDEDNRLFFGIGENGSEDALNVWQTLNGETMQLASGMSGLFAEDPACATIVAKSSEGKIDLDIYYCNGEIETVSPEVQDSLISEGLFRIICTYTSSRADRFSFDNIYYGPIRIDESPPRILDLLLGSEQTRIVFNERIELPLVEFFVITPDMIIPDNIVQNGSEITLDWNPMLPKSTELELDIIGISDLAGNVLDTTITFTLNAQPNVGDVLFNEVLSDPVGSGSDYIELINASEAAIDLQGMLISNESNGRSIEITQSIVVEPNKFVLLTDDPADIRSRYPTLDAHRFYMLELPSMANASGRLRLKFNDEMIDQFDYNEDLHHFLYDDTEGVSLERISINLPSTDASNWSSASEQVGYGTPGLANSISGIIGQNVFDMKSRVISPNDDGLNDFLVINYQLDAPDYLAEISIYSDQGAKVISLLNNGTVGAEGEWTWNGLNQDGKAVKQGVYVFLVELFNRVERHSYKQSFAVSRNR